ncbi:MAG: DUF2752 domain-containing protein [Lachnospiraceae bacterium]|nr:DUF2752 domain-containing protein [Lachnospiraceae bacterium]
MGVFTLITAYYTVGFDLRRYTPPCMLYTFTGYYCPGCGGTRAFIYLLKGQLVKSLIHHPAVIYAVLPGLLFMISQTIYKLQLHFSHSSAKEQSSTTTAPHASSEEQSSTTTAPYASSEEQSSTTTAPYTSSEEQSSTFTAPHASSEEQSSTTTAPHASKEQSNKKPQRIICPLTVRPSYIYIGVFLIILQCLIKNALILIWDWHII